ncbi:MFS transporter [Streptomyces sp. HU2014]|uniref:MFS transporter n=1 Tax=Streptomyces albireticuli TaxID=1940 RepID=A0A1Z2LDX0_9ACTN|nr:MULTISPECIES: MFS transporter [Streptomyces]ARZ72482.1 MFS transporter [Streptomyces albireticuli]UQI45831.1 MFS transporter [Streptomyces sp. HU2014]
MPLPSLRSRRAALTVCCTGLFMVGIDVTALNVALPSMERDLGASVSGMQWAVASYSLALAALMLLAGSTGDRFGHRRIFQVGLMMFTGSSVLCAFAPTLEWLVVFRVLQAAGAAGLGPVTMAIIANVFPDKDERTRALGAWMTGYSLGLALGPVAGGVLVTAVGWRSVFWINLPVGLAAMAVASRSVPESRAERPRGLDPVGQVLVITLLGPLAYAIIEAPQAGWASPIVITCLAVAAASLAGLLVYERHHPEPLIELGFFRNIRFSGAVLGALCLFGTFGGFFFLSALYLQDALGMSPLRAGLWMLPPSLALGGSSLLAGRLAARYGPRKSLVVACTAMIVSGILLTALADDPSRVLLLVEYVLLGVGIGLSSPLLMTMTVAGMPHDRAGLASGIFTAMGRTGFSLGVAVLGAILSTGLHNSARNSFTTFAHAVRPAWAVMAGCGVAVLLLSLLITSKRAEDSADRHAAEQPASPRP